LAYAVGIQLEVIVRSLVSIVLLALVATSAAANPLTAEDVRSWLDGFMPNALDQGDIAGAVVVVVKDGEVLAQAGYGYSDVDARTPVDAAHTLFRVGSVSKLFTWTAVMQLVEQGKLDLDADVNRYLDFAIPARDGKPITLRNIMTHTAGFEERLTGLIGIDGEPIEPLGPFLKRYIPTRIFAPGQTPAYSNYATALAGYIVARVSGEAFDDYMESHLFKPLQMSDATFRQPLPASFRTRLSKAYVAASLPAKPIEIVGPAPAGSLTLTGPDMAHFMIAHLQNGRYDSQQILKPETARYMHDTALTILPRVNRMLLGFYEDNYNGHRVIAHGGDTQWFHSDLHLFIDDGVGLFVSFNSVGKDGAVQPLRSNLFHQFADRYFPGPAPRGTVDVKHAGMIAGEYIPSRRFETSFLRLLYLFLDTKVIDNGDGTISVSTEKSPVGVPRKWREIAPFVWEQDGALLAAQVVDGRVTRFAYGEGSPFEVFDRPPAWQSGTVLMPLLVGALLALVLNSLAWPVSALTRRHYGAAYGLKGSEARAHRLVRIASVAAAVVFIGWTTVALTVLSKLDLSSKLTGWIMLLEVLAPFAFVGGAAAGLWSVWVVLRGQRRWFTKVWSVVLAAALLTVLWAAVAFHLIGFRSVF
jgi:CubicO group peptidase (beta-lactamase class C family)